MTYDERFYVLERLHRAIAMNDDHELSAVLTLALSLVEPLPESAGRFGHEYRLAVNQLIEDAKRTVEMAMEIDALLPPDPKIGSPGPGPES